MQKKGREVSGREIEVGYEQSHRRAREVEREETESQTELHESHDITVDRQDVLNL